MSNAELARRIAEAQRAVIREEVARAMRAPTGIPPGTYNYLTVNALGRAVAGDQGSAALLRRTGSATTVATGSLTTIPFDTNEYDNGAFVTGSSPYTTLTMAKAGLYYVHWEVEIPTIAAGAVEFYVYDTSSTARAKWKETSPTLTTFVGNGAFVHPLTDGVSVSLRCLQNSGGNISVWAYLGIIRVG
jgi:hypothetical protein